MGIWNLLAADANGLEVLIKVGLFLLFILGPYLLQLLGGKAVQDDRGNAGGNRRREPQSDLEREIADFLEQSRRGDGTASSRTPAESVEARSADDFVEAEVAPETLRDHHLAPSTIETQSFGQTGSRSPDERVYARRSRADDEFQYEEPESYSYDTEQTSTSNAGASIAAMFREPEKVRNAFILGEIINRPKFPRRS